MHHVSVKKRKRERERACDGGGGRLAAVGWSRAAWRAACGGPLAAGRSRRAAWLEYYCRGREEVVLLVVVCTENFFLEKNYGSSKFCYCKFKI